MSEASAPARPTGWRLLGIALRSRKAGQMLGFGFSSGLPYALLIGTLNAWLGEKKIDLATIGVLSWVGLAYSFKFLWSPVVDRLPLAGFDRLGRRKSWIFACQIVLVAALALLAATDPTRAMGRFALIALVAALASATQDVAIDAWRIDVADELVPVELLSSLYQLGYRIAAIVGGAFALLLAARFAWPVVYGVMAGVLAVIALLTPGAPDTPRPAASAEAALAVAGELTPAARGLSLAVVGLGWTWAIATIGSFMVAMLSPLAPGAKHPSVADFTRSHAPLIVLATVGVPLVIAALTTLGKARGIAVQTTASPPPRAIGRLADHLYIALVVPLAELVARLGWGVLVVIGMILSYTLCYNIWGTFALPFYLDFLHYTKDEIAFASKVFGIFMTIAGISIGGILFVRLGRLPTILIGAILPVLGNFVYADLAEGAVHLDAVARTVGLTALLGHLGCDERLVRLLLAIGVENISTGIAGAAFVAYLSGIVSRRYTAVQYALLSSMTFLIGSLGRGLAGETIDRFGYPVMFRMTALAGLVAVAFVGLEGLRSAIVNARISRESRD